MVRAIPAPGAVGRPRSFFDQMVAFAQSLGAPGPGLGRAGRRRGQGADRQVPRRRPAGRAARGGRPGRRRCRVLRLRPGRMRRPSSRAWSARASARSSGLIAKDCYRFCWIVDFPMYEWDEEAKAVTFSHNPFSMPQGGMEALRAPGSADDPGLPVRHRLQRDRAELGRDPQPSAGHHGQGVRARGLRPRGAGGEVRRHVPRAAIRRAAAWRDRARASTGS